jgi:hypothetical protein
MTIKLGTIATRSLLAAGLALGIASAHARDYNVTRDQEQAVQPGMTSSDVKAALGSPTAVQSVGNEPGPIWTYQVANVTPVAPGGRRVFDIHFGADGRVATTNESLMEPVNSSD